MDRPNEHTEMSSLVDEVSDDEVYEDPQGELELALAQVWRDAFRLEKIGRNDNFFGLGGNSLLGMELTEMLATRLDIQIPVVVLFQYPSIRELAEVLVVDDQP
jgi:hypothetical protein